MNTVSTRRVSVIVCCLLVLLFQMALTALADFYGNIENNDNKIEWSATAKYENSSRKGTYEVEDDGVTITATTEGLTSSFWGISNDYTTTTVITITNTNQTIPIKLLGTINFSASSGGGSYSIDHAGTDVSKVELPQGTSSYNGGISIAAGGTATISVSSNKSGNVVKMTFTPNILATAYSVKFKNISTYGTYTVDGNTVFSGSTQEYTTDISTETGTAVKITPVSGKTCIGFLNESSGKMVAGVPSEEDNTITFIPTGSGMILSPVYIDTPTGLGPYLVANQHYHTWESAFAAAINADNLVTLAVTEHTLPTTPHTLYMASGVTLIRQYTTVSNNKVTGYKVPANTKFLIPYDSTLNPDITARVLDASSGTATGAYATMTVPAGLAMTVDGALIVNAVVASRSADFTGVPFGTYGKMILEGDMIVNGSLHARGFITGSSTKTGKITACSGAGIYMPLQILDGRGGSIMSGIKDSMFPVSNYVFNSIMLPVEYQFGSAMYCQYALNALGSDIFENMPMIISNASGTGNGMFILKNGNFTLDYQYEGDRIIADLDGDVVMNSLSISVSYYPFGSGVAITIPVTTASTELPVNGNFTANIHSGATLSFTKGDVKLLPGVKINIAHGGELEVSKSLYIYQEEAYDGQWNKSTATSPLEGRLRANAPGLVQNANTTVSDGDAVITVEGTLNASGNIWVSNTATVPGVVAKNGGVININTAYGSTPTINEYVLTGSDAMVDVTSWVPVTGLLAGVSNSSTDYNDSFGAISTAINTTYYGTDAWVDGNNGCWYQHVVTVKDGIKGITAVNSGGSVGETSTYTSVVRGEVATENVVGYAVSGGTFKFKAADNVESVSVNGTVLSPDMDGVYTLTVNTDTELVVVCNHKNTETIGYAAPDCTEPGQTGDTTCVDCGYLVSANAEIPALGHTEITDAAVNATCTETGLTEGKHCSVCGEVTVAQEEIPALGHSDSNLDCRCDSCGERMCIDSNDDHSCDNCGKPMCIDSNTDGKCDTCGAFICKINFIEGAYKAEVVLRLYLDIPDALLENDTATVTLTKDGRWGDVEFVYTTAQLKEAGKTQYGYIVEAGVASGEIARDISVEIVYAEDGAEKMATLFDSSGNCLGKSTEFSVLYYSELTYRMGNEKQKTMMDALLSYGYYAELYFDVDSENRIKNLMTQFERQIANLEGIDKNTPAAIATQTGGGFGITVNSIETHLDSAVFMRLIFASDEAPSAYTFTLTRPNSESTQLTTDGEKPEVYYDANSKTCYVEIRDVPAAYMDDAYTVTIKRTADDQTYVVSINVLRWVQQALTYSTNENQINLAKAIYNYNQAADVFFSE